VADDYGWAVEMRRAGASIDDIKHRAREMKLEKQGFKPDPSGGYVRRAPGAAPGSRDSRAGDTNSAGDWFAGLPTSPSASTGKDLAAFGVGASEDFAFGLPAKAMEATGILSKEDRERIKAESPTAGNIGGWTGLALSSIGGPEAAIARGVGAGAKAARVALPAMGRTAAARVATSAGEAALSGAATGAAKTAVDGGSLGDIADSAKGGAVIGGVVGGAAKGIAEGGRAVASKIGDPRTLMGRTVEYLQKGKKSGHFDTPEFKDLPAGKAGYNEAADNAGQKITAYNQQQLKAARSDYGKRLDTILEDSGDVPVPLDNVHARIETLDTENMVNGVRVDEKLGAALDKTTRMLSRKTLDGTQLQGGTLRDVIKAKKAVEKMAEFGGPVTADNRPYRIIYKELADEASALDPRLAKLNAEYGKTISKLERANDILYGKEVPDVAGRASSERQAAARLGRLGDDTQAGTVGERQLEELAALDHKYAELLDSIELKKAYERTRYGMPQMSKSPEKWGLGLLEQNAGALTARVLDPAARGAASGASVASRAAPAITNPIVRARQKEKEREERRTATLRGHK
jgi:hypothetical protein